MGAAAQKHPADAEVQPEDATWQVGLKARVKASGRKGVVVRYDPQDEQLTYKVEFADGADPLVDWFARDKVEDAAEEEDEDLCPICLESPGDSLALPCACKVSYCMRCWDRSLAGSLAAVGATRCPTCRLPVRVDFDAEAGRLLFSPEMGDGPGAWALRDRLTTQARPLQERILRAYGSAHPELAAPARAPEEALRGLQPPKCVCGCLLQRVSGRDRMRAFAHRQEVDLSEDQLDACMRRVGADRMIICDLCDEGIQLSNSTLWSCEAGGDTILHAQSYDVCERCFARHVCGASVA